jgi:hypothetical protein
MKNILEAIHTASVEAVRGHESEVDRSIAKGICACIVGVSYLVGGPSAAWAVAAVLFILF